jgi:sugar/nucleoside kinase (ribokinase family)
MKDIVVAGHICLDIIPDLGPLKSGLKSAFSPGKLSSIGAVSVSTGGPVSNTGLALFNLGMPVKLMGKLGDDALGKVILNNLDAFDQALSKDMIIVPSINTSYTIVISPPGVDRMFLHHSGANDSYSSSDIPWDQIKKNTLFHFGYPPLMANMYKNNGADLVELFKIAKSRHVVTSLDMAYPDSESDAAKADWESILSKTLPYVDIFMPSLDEIQFMLKSSLGLPQMGNKLLNMGAGMVLLKLGDKGLYLRTSENAERLGFLSTMGHSDISPWLHRELYSPCFEVKVAGTTGAGDCTIAGFLAALIKSLPPGEALNAAVAVGAFNVEVSDSTSGIRHWDKVQTRIRNGWEKYAPDMKLAPWKPTIDGSVFLGPSDVFF